MITDVSEALMTKWRDIGIKEGLTMNPVFPGVDLAPAVTPPEIAAHLRDILDPVYKDVLQRETPEEYILAPSPQAAWDIIAQREYPEDPKALEFIWPDLDGHWFSHYYIWVDLYKELGLDILKLYDVYARTRTLDIIYPMTKYCVVSDTPRNIKTIQKGEFKVLHCEDGMALNYADGWGLYSLNGVRVPETVVLTKPEDLTKEWIQKNFLGQVNVDVCREIIRKFSIETIYKFLDAEVLDTVEMYIDSDQVLYESAASLPKDKEVKMLPYELVMLRLSKEIVHPYLRMENASLPGVYHLEAVGRDCRTVREALTFRNGTSELPKTLS